MSWDKFYDGVLSFFILFCVAFIFYTLLKKQNLGDTWNEFKELFIVEKEEVIPYY